jgi:predicted ATP-dependent serine protease
MSKPEENSPRAATDIRLPGLEFFLAGVIPRGGQVLLYGPKGAGKSTIAAEVAGAAQADGQRVGYILTEQSAGDHLHLLRSLRLPTEGFGLRELSDPAALLPYADVDLLIVDSLNGLGQIRSQAAYGRIISFIRLCRKRSIATVLLSHATKAGTATGPSSLQHVVDAVLRLAPAGGNFVLQTEKRRRLGPWAAQGLVKEVPLVLGPSGFAYSPHAEPTVATAMSFAGGRLAQVQALVCLPPRRLHCPFLPTRRIRQLLTTLQEQAGVNLDPEQIGLSLLADRPYDATLDLALAAAINASYLHEAVPADCVFIGGVDLNGVIQPLSADAAAIGVALTDTAVGRLLVSSASAGLIAEMVPDSVEVIGVSSIRECLARLRK